MCGYEPMSRCKWFRKERANDTDDDCDKHGEEEEDEAEDEEEDEEEEERGGKSRSSCMATRE